MKQLTTEPPTSSSLRLLHDASTTREVVGNWHREAHTGAFWVCMEQPCHAVNRLDD